MTYTPLAVFVVTQKLLGKGYPFHTALLTNANDCPTCGAPIGYVCASRETSGNCRERYELLARNNEELIRNNRELFFKVGVPN